MIAEPKSKTKQEKFILSTQGECISYYGYNGHDKNKEDKDTFIEKFEANIEEKESGDTHSLGLFILSVISAIIIGGPVGIKLGVWDTKDTTLLVVGPILWIIISILGAIVILGTLGMITEAKVGTRKSSKHKKLAWDIVMQKKGDYDNTIATPEQMEIMKSKKFSKALTRYRKYATKAAHEADQSVQYEKRKAEYERKTAEERTGIFTRV